MSDEQQGHRHEDHGHGHGQHHGHGHAEVADEELSAEELYTPEFWDERYRTAPKLWSGQPNAQLVANASDLTPGAALDVGCGEGGDVIWLARQGWQVTGVDVSQVALDRAAEHAAEAGDDIAARTSWQQVDLLTWAPPTAAYDLVTSHFIHLPPEIRSTVQAGLAAAVRPGGSLLIVGHDRSDLHTTINRPNLPDLFFGADELAAELDPAEWEVLVAATPEREAVDPEGRTVTIKDAVLLARRRG